MLFLQMSKYYSLRPLNMVRITVLKFSFSYLLLDYHYTEYILFVLNF
jgi:hypothetical protein